MVVTVAFGGPIIAALAPSGGTAGLQSLIAPGVRSPKVKPGDFLRLALELQALSEGGLTPVVSTDPFTGDFVISTSDQSLGLFNLLGEKFAREALAATPEETAGILRARDEVIRSPSPAGPAEPTVRDQVVASLTPSTAKLVAPGVVARKSSSLAVSSRLGGPCAAANTGFSRLNCARGGFA